MSPISGAKFFFVIKGLEQCKNAWPTRPRVAKKSEKNYGNSSPNSNKSVISSKHKTSFEFKLIWLCWFCHFFKNHVRYICFINKNYLYYEGCFVEISVKRIAEANWSFACLGLGDLPGCFRNQTSEQSCSIIPIQKYIDFHLK